ncbi:MAG: hypothetical protein AAGI12_15150 [Pseudomonadota bacterium]
MTIEVLSVLVYALLLFAVILVQANYAAVTADLAYGFSNREAPQPGKSDAEWLGRELQRAVARRVLE